MFGYKFLSDAPIEKYSKSRHSVSVGRFFICIYFQMFFYFSSSNIRQLLFATKCLQVPTVLSYSLWPVPILSPHALPCPSLPVAPCIPLPFLSPHTSLCLSRVTFRAGSYSFSEARATARPSCAVARKSAPLDCAAASAAPLQKVRVMSQVPCT